jgi:hypothetical protein
MEDLVGFKGQDELIRGGMEELIGLNCWPDCFHDNHCRWHLLEPGWRISLSPLSIPKALSHQRKMAAWQVLCLLRPSKARCGTSWTKKL